MKKDKLCQLREALAENQTVNSVTKYYVLLPEEEAHHEFHQTHGAASYAQRIHPKLVNKIYELVREGTAEVQEVKRALRNYVQCILLSHFKTSINRSLILSHYYRCPQSYLFGTACLSA